uniref:Uncharacterized protein n=1 Tax=Nothoprocta perdicaria TaxID=30464 RepID=A0A8C6ZJB9_NOTPE
LTFEEEELREQCVKCLNNCAAAELRLERPEAALASCEAALRLSPDNGKALLRRGKLLAEQGRDEEAALALRRALQLEPASKVRAAGSCAGGSPRGCGGDGAWSRVTARGRPARAAHGQRQRRFPGHRSAHTAASASERASLLRRKGKEPGLQLAPPAAPR